MAEEIDLEKCNFRNFRSPRPWPWIGSYGILLCITHRPLSEKLFVDGRTYVRTDVRTYWRTFQTPLWRSVNLICGALEEHLLTHSNAIRLTRRSRPNNSRLCRILKYKQYLGKCNWLTLVTKIWTLWHCDNDATFLGKVNTLEQNARVITKHRHESTTLKVQKTILIGVYRHNSSVSEIYHTTKKCAGSWDYQILLQKQGNAFMLALENIYRHIVIFFCATQIHILTYAGHIPRKRSQLADQDQHNTTE